MKTCVLTSQKNLEVKWLFNFLTSSYNQRYCCCPNRDFKIKFEDKNGDSILFYVDTVYNKDEFIFYPPNYNFCLETKDKLLLDLLKNKLVTTSFKEKD